MNPRLCAVFAATALLLMTGALARAQDWSPFNDGTEPPRSGRRPVPPAVSDERPPLSAAQRDGAAGTPLPPLSVVIEQGSLAPLDLGPPMVGSPTTGTLSGPIGSGGPSGRALDPRGVQDLFVGLDIPSRSPALARAYQRLLAGPPTQGQAGDADAVRSEALLRAGLIREAGQAVAGADPRSSTLAAGMAARLDVAIGDRERGCRTAQSMIANGAALPPPLKSELFAVTGLCAALSGNKLGAGLAAQLARDEGAADTFALSALDAIALGDKPRLDGSRRIGPIDYRLYEAAGGDDVVGLLERLEPASLALLADADRVDPRLRVAAFEAAARLNVIPPKRLADLWRQQTFTTEELGGAATQVSPLLRRALLFRIADQERNPARKVRTIRALLDDTRRGGLYFASLAALSGPVRQVEPVSEVGWFAETAVEVLLASGDFEAARRWARLGSGPDRPPGQQLDHWQALIDIADPAMRSASGQNLASVEALALRGRFTPALLHRLATVLDALDTNVPIALWEAASRTPQPTTGYLPATGVLAELAAASKARDDLRTVLLAIKTMGPGTPETINILALGDIIRALKRSGLESDARQVGLEALVAEWPRATGS